MYWRSSLPTAQEIFQRLISDPDYVAQNGKTREQVVWEEAKQRERQHKNNQAALSMAWDNSPTLKSFIEYLYKADDIEPVTKPVFYGPLQGIRDAIQLHQAYEDDLPWAGDDRVGTLASLVEPHARALKTIMGKHTPLFTDPASERHSHRKNLNMEVNETSEDDTTGEFDPSVLANLLRQYGGLEQDMRAISNEVVHGGRLLKLGNSPVTRDQTAPSQSQRPNQLQNWMQALNSGGYVSSANREPVWEDGRKAVLDQILGYLPSFEDLPEASEQLSMLSNDERQAGMYGNREVVSNTAENDPNWANLDFFNEESVQSALANGMIQYNSIQNTNAGEKANNDAVLAFLVKNQGQLPQNRAFDHDHVGSPEIDPKLAPNLSEDFNTFMRLTFWNPDETVGASNLWNILQSSVKLEDSDQDRVGYYTLPIEATSWMANMGDLAKETFLSDLLRSPMPINRLNPDERGNSGINGSLHSYSDIEDEIRGSLIKGKHISTGFNILQDPAADEQQDIYTALRPNSRGDSPLQKLMSDLGVLIDTETMSPIEIQAKIDSVFNAEDETEMRDMYTGIFPFSYGSTGRTNIGEPLPHANKESRDFSNRPEYSEIRRVSGQKTGRIRTEIQAAQKTPLSISDKLNISEDGGGYGYKDEYDRIERFMSPRRNAQNGFFNAADRRKQEHNGPLEDKIESLQASLKPEKVTFIRDNPKWEEQYERIYESIKQDLLRQYRGNVTDDMIREALEDSHIYQQFLHDTPQTITEEEEGIYREENGEKIELTESEEKSIREEINKTRNQVDNSQINENSHFVPPEDRRKYADAIRLVQEGEEENQPKLQAILGKYVNEREAEIRAEESMADAQIRDMAKPIFRTVRQEDLLQVIAKMQEDGVVPSEASSRLGIVLTAGERQMLDSLVPPIISAGQASGDVIAHLGGEEVSKDNLRPTLNLSFDMADVKSEKDGEAYEDLIKRIVNNHPVYQELEQLLAGLNIDLNLLHSSYDPLHGNSPRTDLYNPERTRRSFTPFQVKDGEPLIDAFDGPLVQNEDGEWNYTGRLFEQNKHNLFAFLNGVDMERILGDIADAPSQDQPEYEYLQNIMQAMEQYETSPARFAARFQQKAELVQQMQAQKEKTGQKITSLSGLPDDILTAFQNVMLELQQHDSQNPVSKYNMPEEMRPIIQELLPIFDQLGDSHEQTHLDDFLLNFYRQFKQRFASEYSQLRRTPLRQDEVGTRMGDDKERFYGHDLNEMTLRGVTADKRIGHEEEETEEREGVEVLGQSKYDPNFASVGALEQFSERSLLDIIDEMLSKEEGQALRQTIGEEPAFIGRTNIPLSIEGVLNEQAIPKIPVLLQFPIDRFRTGERISTTLHPEYGVVPTVWLWFKEHANYLTAMSEQSKLPLTKMLSMPDGKGGFTNIIDAKGKITLESMREWLAAYNFRVPIAGAGATVPSYKGSTLPDGFIIDETHMAVPTSRTDSYRRAFRDVKNRESDVLGQVSDLEQMQNFFKVEGETTADKLKAISQIPEIQEYLNSLYGSAEQAFGSELVSGYQNIQYDPVTGAVLRDEEGEPVTDPVLRGTMESQLINLSGLQDNDLLKPRIGQDEEGNPFWDISGTVLSDDEPEGDHPFISRLYARLHDVLEQFEPEFYDARMEYYIDPTKPVERMSEGQVQKFTSKSPGEDGEKVEYTMPIPEAQDEEHRAYDPEWQDKANMFYTLSDMFQLIRYLRDIHVQNQISLPGFITRNPDRFYLDHGSLRDTIENFTAAPLDPSSDDPTVMIDDLVNHFPADYFKNYEEDTMGLKSPTTAEDIAIQVSGLQKYLDSKKGETRVYAESEQLEEERRIESTITGYIDDLKQISRQFNIPNIDEVGTFSVQARGRKHAEKENMVNEDGTFRLFDNAGNVDGITRAFLQPLYTLRGMAKQDDELAVLLTNRMLDNAGIFTGASESQEIVPTITKEVRGVLKTLQRYGEQQAEHGETNLFSSLFTPDGDINVASLVNLLREGDDHPYLKFNPKTGGYSLPMGKAHPDGTHRDPSSANYSPGIMGWLHDRWENYFSTEGIPERYTRGSKGEPTWASGRRINDHIESIIDRGPREFDVGVGTSTEEGGGIDAFTVDFETMLSSIQDGTSEDPLADLKTILENEDGSTWSLDMNDFTQLHSALTEGGYDNINEVLSGINRATSVTDEDFNTLVSPPVEAPPDIQPEGPGNLEIPDVSTEQPQEDLTVPGLEPEINTQMDLFNTPPEETE